MSIQAAVPGTNPRIPPASPQGAPARPAPSEDEVPDEVGASKSAAQHVGNAGFGSASLGSVGAGLKRLAGRTAQSRLGRYLPGLNVGVAALETYNASRKALQGDPVVAMTHAGNAAGCLGAVLDQAGGFMALGTSRLGIGVTLGMVGGGLGVAAGAFEVKQGLAIRRAGGPGRTLAMGVLDLASGTTSLLGAGLAAAGVGGALGPALLIGAGFCDLSGVVVDYLGHRLFPARP